jgi:hypothetical protein
MTLGSPSGCATSVLLPSCLHWFVVMDNFPHGRKIQELNHNALRPVHRCMAAIGPVGGSVAIRTPVAASPRGPRTASDVATCGELRTHDPHRLLQQCNGRARGAKRHTCRVPPTMAVPYRPGPGRCQPASIRGPRFVTDCRHAAGYNQRINTTGALMTRPTLRHRRSLVRDVVAVGLLRRWWRRRWRTTTTPPRRAVPRQHRVVLSAVPAIAPPIQERLRQ